MSLRTTIGISFLFLAFFSLAVILRWEGIALFMFCIWPLGVIYLVYRVLKTPYKPTHTFDERFYEDYDYERNR